MTLLLAFTVALCTSLLLTPVARAAANQLGIVDRPDGQRKLQAAPVALWGGVAVYCGMSAGLLVATLVRVPGESVPARLSILLIISGGLLGLVGLIDDAHNLRARTKLVLQVVAVSPLVLAGFFPERMIVLGTEISLGLFGPPVMIVWLVACVNALNLLDGLDGFASVVGITLATAVTAIGLLSGNFAAAVAALALAGALLGFLPFNFPPATIYLGDAGSMMIGLSLGALSIQVTDITGQSFIAVVPLAIMAVPLWDSAMAVVRRRFRGVPVSEGDREHLHHRLVGRGLTNVQALLFVSFLCLSGAGAVMLALLAGWELLALLAAATIAAALAATRIFGEEELGLLRRAAAAWTAATTAPLALPPPYQGIKLQRMLHGLDLDGSWDLFTKIADLLECDSAELAFSDDCAFPPRSYRVKASRDSRGTDAAGDCTVATTCGTLDGLQCDLRASFSHSGPRGTLYAACLTNVLAVFSEHFLHLATAEASVPLFHVISDEQEHSGASGQRRAA